MSRTSKISEAFKEYLNQNYSFFKNRPVYIKDNVIFTQNGTPIAYFESKEDSLGVYKNYLIVTLQDFKSQKNWKSIRQKIIQEAMKEDYIIMFVPEIDIFVNCENNNAINEKIYSYYELANLLLKTRKIMNFEVKRNLLYFQNNINFYLISFIGDNDDTFKYYITFDQIDIDGSPISACKICSEYILGDSRMNNYILLHEPNYNELVTLIHKGYALYIHFLNIVEDRNFEIDYINLVTAIHNKSIRNPTASLPVKYQRYNIDYEKKYIKRRKR